MGEPPSQAPSQPRASSTLPCQTGVFHRMSGDRTASAHSGDITSLGHRGSSTLSTRQIARECARCRPAHSPPRLRRFRSSRHLLLEVLLALVSTTVPPPFPAFPFQHSPTLRRLQAAEELHKIVLDHEMRFAVTLILANKSDLPHALSADEVKAEVRQRAYRGPAGPQARPPAREPASLHASPARLPAGSPAFPRARPPASLPASPPAAIPTRIIGFIPSSAERWLASPAVAAGSASGPYVPRAAVERRQRRRVVGGDEMARDEREADIAAIRQRRRQLEMIDGDEPCATRWRPWPLCQATSTV